MKTAAILPAQIPAPALALAAFPALLTVGLVGIVLYAVSDLQRSGAVPDPFQLWKDHSGTVRELKVVGLRNDPEGSQVEFVTRAGLPLSRPITDLQRADQERAWEAAFALKPVLSFRDAAMLKADTGSLYDHYYHLNYTFDVSVLPINRVVENSISLNHVPIEGLHGMALLPSAWTFELNLNERLPRGPVDRDQLRFSTSGYFSPLSLKGAVAEGQLTAICAGDLTEEKVVLKVPSRPGVTSKASVGPIQLRLTTSGSAPELRKLALEVSGANSGQLSYAGFNQEGPRSDVRTTYIEGSRSEITVSTGYYRRVKTVVVPFSGTPE
ncbi:hypothetical protein [Haloferula sp. BvORR071]|uniref:hypothetical protein n=1 Tax=Haloferula sp. BvORR071 TaxID=1396141 RepID=UPI00054D0597|nr:hypothetical protein [Haloferula sp. BvORR071]